MQEYFFFGKNPRFYMPGAYVQYVRFSGEDEISDFEYEHRFWGWFDNSIKDYEWIY